MTITQDLSGQQRVVMLAISFVQLVSRGEHRPKPHIVKTNITSSTWQSPTRAFQRVLETRSLEPPFVALLAELQIG